MKLYRNHRDEVRDLDQIIGANVVPFRPRDPWPCELGKEPPKFLKREDKDRDQD